MERMGLILKQGLEGGKKDAAKIRNFINEINSNLRKDGIIP